MPFMTDCCDYRRSNPAAGPLKASTKAVTVRSRLLSSIARHLAPVTSDVSREPALPDHMVFEVFQESLPF